MARHLWAVFAWIAKMRIINSNNLNYMNKVNLNEVSFNKVNLSEVILKEVNLSELIL